MIAAALAGTLAVGLSGCGGGGSDSTAGTDKPSSPAGGRHSADVDSGTATPSPSSATVLAQMKGSAGMTVTINSAVRDHDGFVTVQGEITNNGTDPFSATFWMGNEIALQASGNSVAGATLIDETGKKRYYVLRDTDGKCLCTMGLTGIEPKQTVPFFAQFPSPPASATDVEFELPTMPPAKITISEG
jgi:hypothetical protein